MMDLRESFTKFYRILDILISASNPFVGPHLKDFELTDTFYVVDYSFQVRVLTVQRYLSKSFTVHITTHLFNSYV